MTSFYLAMAIFWLLLGAALIVHSHIHPFLGANRMTLELGGHHFSLGWFALVLVAYNLVRWWSFRVTRRQQGELQAAVQQRERQLEAERREEHRVQDAPNPAFDISKPANPEQGPPPT